MFRFVLYIVLGSPGIVLGFWVWSDASKSTFYLGADPAEYILQVCGTTAASLMIATLLFSPLRRFRLMPVSLLQFRRPIGVASFFYALFHALVFVQFYVGWSTRALGHELLERPYILVGAMALLMMSLLAITSNNWSLRVLVHRWRSLHRLNYVVAMLFVIHFFWQVRADYFEFALFLLLVIFALGERAWRNYVRPKGPG